MRRTHKQGGEEIAGLGDPAIAAAAAALRLLACGDPDGTVVAGGCEATSFLVGGIEQVEADKPDADRPAQRRGHGKSEAAAAPAAVISGAAPSRKNTVNTPDAVMIPARLAPMSC